MKKIIVILITVVCTFLIISVIAEEKQPASVQPDTATGISVPETKEKSASPAQLSLTLEELAKYNGTNGKPAYVAVDGIIHDVSSIRAWKKGMHKGRHTAGAELGDAIKKKSPHGIKVLKKLKVVGKVVPSSD